MKHKCPQVESSGEMDFYLCYKAWLADGRPAGGPTGKYRWLEAPEQPAPAQRRASSEASPAVLAQIKQRDGGKCFFCKSREDSQVHHMTYRSKGGDHNPENLLLVCGTCHARLHEGEPVHRLMQKRLQVRRSVCV